MIRFFSDFKNRKQVSMSPVVHAIHRGFSLVFWFSSSFEKPKKPKSLGLGSSVFGFSPLKGENLKNRKPPVKSDLKERGAS